MLTAGVLYELCLCFWKRLRQNDLLDMVVLNYIFQVIEASKHPHAVAVGMDKAMVLIDKADDFLPCGAFHVGREEVAVETRQRRDADDERENGLGAVRCGDGGMSPHLGVAEEVQEESLHQDERDGDSRSVGVDSVDMRDAEAYVAATGQQKAEKKRAAQMVVVVGSREVPEDAVRAGAAQDDHQDARIA